MCVWVFVCVCVRACWCDTQLLLSEASLPWLKIKNACTVSPQGAIQTDADWQQQREEEKRESRKNRKGENMKGQGDASKGTEAGRDDA